MFAKGDRVVIEAKTIPHTRFTVPPYSIGTLVERHPSQTQFWYVRMDIEIGGTGAWWFEEVTLIPFSEEKSHPMNEPEFSLDELGFAESLIDELRE